MSKKRELIDKEVILITQTNGVLYKRLYNQCYKFNDTYSISLDGWNYYCKNDGYYATFAYTLILDKDLENEATHLMISLMNRYYDSEIKDYKDGILELKKRKQNLCDSINNDLIIIKDDYSIITNS